MKQQQSGFTLIELIVVIVILGILAATAVPRFVSLTDNANLAVAQGVLGSISSSAVIQLGTAPIGQAKTFATIISQADFANLPNPTDITVAGGDSGGTAQSTGGAFASTITCDTTGAGTTVTVTIDTQSAAGLLSNGLCSG